MDIFQEGQNTTRLIVLSLLILLFSANSFAHTMPFLTLQKAWQKVQISNPGLKSSGFGIAAALGDVTQSRFIPNPSLNVVAENFGGNRSAQDEESDTTVWLNQPIQLGDKRHLRMQTASSQYGASVLVFKTQKTRAFLQTTESFLSVAQAQAQFRLAQQAVRINQQTVNTIQRRATAGRAPELELKSAQVALADQKILEKTALQQWLSARYNLASLWGGSLSDVKEVTLQSFNTGWSLPSLPSLMNLLQNNASLKAFKQQAKVAHTEVGLARANGKPDINIGAGYRHFNQTNDHAYVAQISLPLPLFNRNQGNIAKALANSNSAIQQWLNQRNALKNELFATYQNAVLARSQVNMLQKNIIPNAQQALALAREGYVQGRFSYLDLLNAQQKLRDEKARYITALFTYRKAWIALQVLVGNLPAQETH
ncbi:MAG: hypothetical protein A3F13_08585 [Gammaproteobacteria bacterium RIFCSPHIGHO2_12_FULL_40_19]|nr:MAG: hypothetical protein A3F13_08585 [Gammaproteobacteria bacterium RIFCSPHIGHO2_12_FULL_40_19]